MNIATRKIVYAAASFLLGLGTAATLVGVLSEDNENSEQVNAACANSEIPLDEFTARTGYHVYDPRVALGASSFVCLLTQFLFDLVKSFPAGTLVWCTIVLVWSPMTVVMSTEAGRRGAQGPIRFQIIMNLIGQAIGVSVMFPLIWLPSFVFGQGERRVPLTTFRVWWSGVLALTAPIVTLICFWVAPIDSELWTTAGGILIGPMLPMAALPLLLDESSTFEATEENAAKYAQIIRNLYKLMEGIGFLYWCLLVTFVYHQYGWSLVEIWAGIWTNASAPVKFMTVDLFVLYLGMILYVAYRSNEVNAVKVCLWTVAVGPCSAISWALMQLEDTTPRDINIATKKRF